MANILLVAANNQNCQQLHQGLIDAGHHVTADVATGNAYRYITHHHHHRRGGQPDVLIVDVALGPIMCDELADHWHHTSTIVTAATAEFEVLLLLVTLAVKLTP